MRDHEDLWTAVRSRERSRSLVRTATLSVGAAGLATAGVIAYTLPAPAHQQSTGGRVSTKPAQPVSQARSGDDGGENDDRSAASAPPSRSAAPAPAQTPPQVTSGGS